MGAGTTYHSGVSWARSLPGPLRRPLSRLVHAAWEGAAELGAIGPDDPRGRRFGRMGAGACLLFPQGAIYNEHLIHIGAETIVGPGASISAGMAPGQEMPTDPVVSIGSRCLIGRGSHIVGHWEIVIGDDIQTGPYVYITDQNHTYEDPVEPIGRQWPTEAPVRIGSGSWLGANAVILPGRADRRARRRGGGRRGARRGPRPLRRRRRAGAHRPALGRGRRLGRREGRDAVVSAPDVARSPSW